MPKIFLVGIIGILGVAAIVFTQFALRQNTNFSSSASGAINDPNLWINSVRFPRLLSRHVYEKIPANLDPVRFSKYDLIYASPFNSDSLKIHNPNIRVLIYDSARAAQTSHDLNVLRPKDYLLYASSKLANTVTPSDTIITVEIGSHFRPNYDAVFLDTNDPLQAEHIHIQEVGVGGNPNALRVIRGFKGRAGNLVNFSPIRSHAKGSQIAMHVMGEKILDDDYDPETVKNKWLINIYTAYETVAQGMVDKVLSSHVDGLKIDSAKSKTFGKASIKETALVDINNDSVPDGGIVNGRNFWGEGVMNLFKSVRTKLSQNGREGDRALIVANGAEPNPWINGRLTQAWLSRISDPNLEEEILVDYRKHFQQDSSPKITNVDVELQNFALSRKEEMKNIRFGLTTALVNGNGFFGNKAEIPNERAHGTDAWYDEYDNGAGSAIDEISVNETTNQINITKGTGQKFKPGDVIYLTSETMKVTSVAQGDKTDVLTVERAFVTNQQRSFLGPTITPQPVKHQLGEKVYTMAQAKSGKGYLGMPTSNPSSDCSSKSFSPAKCMRFFDGGIVVVNPTDSVKQFSITGDYYKINGSQDRSINDGTKVNGSISVAGKDGLILVKPAAAPPKIKPGNANLDDLVNEADFDIWKLNYNKTAAPWPDGRTKANFNSDGLIDGLDYAIWFTNFKK